MSGDTRQSRVTAPLFRRLYGKVSGAFAITWLTGKRGIRTGQKRKHSCTMIKLRTALVQNCGSDQQCGQIFVPNVSGWAE
ncbi:hypothetical protein NG99_12950 [Erwinia typographi]|uniref:Uncharacterized protein n=1 Tax=Erwinia typographi TaxID=371042 RepID=A0A0A3Z5C2_9GAMM|nr:hypothetical protein NG99_12950 [Erwinia typographi]